MTAVERANRIATIIAELSGRDRRGEPMPSLTELAGRYGVSPGDISADLRVLGALNDSAEAEWFLSLSAYQTEREVMVSSRGPFRRPIRPTPREAVALIVGLAAESDGALPPGLRALVEPHHGTAPRVALTPVAGALDEIHDVILGAIRDTRCLELEYAGDRHDGVTVRTVHPHELITGNGRSVTVAWCELRDGWRRFRTDRVLSARPIDRPFRRRDDAPTSMFDPPDGGVDEVTVRFAPGVARWLAERFPGAEVRGDGSVDVTYPCANPEWLIREVLQYGDQAEIVAPPAYRALMRAAVTGTCPGDA